MSTREDQIRELVVASSLLSNAHYDAIEKITGEGCIHALGVDVYNCRCMEQHPEMHDEIAAIWAEYTPKFTAIATAYLMVAGRKLVT